MYQNLLDRACPLVKIFQCAILDLAAKLEEQKDTLAEKVIEDTKYVIGMAEVNSRSLLFVSELGADYYFANKEKVDRLIREATGFAAALQKDSLGLLPEGV